MSTYQFIAQRLAAHPSDPATLLVRALAELLPTHDPERGVGSLLMAGERAGLIAPDERRAATQVLLAL